jgi:DNA-binding LacI/PurR family transcriptional regulator
VEHLLEGGSRRIAIVLGPAERSDTKDRLAGYRKALAERDVAVDSDLVAQGDFTVLSGYEAMRRLLPQRPDGVFATNDLMAVGVLRALTEAGLRVPDDVAVAGFDDLPIAATTEPALTTVAHDIDVVGEAAVETLLRLLDSDAPRPTEPIVVPAPLLVRQSTRARPTEAAAP